VAVVQYTQSIHRTTQIITERGVVGEGGGGRGDGSSAGGGGN